MSDSRSRSEPETPLRIRLSEERRDRLVSEIRRFVRREFELELSEFQASRLLGLLLRRLGAPVYNQAIQDARGFLLAKLDDLDGEFYEPDEES